MADEIDPRTAGSVGEPENVMAGSKDGADAAARVEAALGLDESATDTDGAASELEPSKGGRRRFRRSITTGLLPDKMLSGDILTAPASLSDFASAPVRETIPYTADPKTAVRQRAREMAKLYGEEEDGPYVNFVVRPGLISAVFYPREAHLLGESVCDMIGDRGGKNYIWCERALSDCHIVVVMDGEVRADLAQAQQNSGQEVRQWLFTMRRHLSQSTTPSGADSAADAPAAPLQTPKLFLHNITLAELGISGSTAAQVETLDQDILEWCWDNTSHLYPLLPVQRALRLVFSRESRVLRSVVFNIAGVILLLSGALYAYTTIYQFFQQREIAQQLAAAQQSRELLDDELVQATDEGSVTAETVADSVVDRQAELVNQPLPDFTANQRDAGVLLEWVLQSILDLGSYVNSDPSGGGHSFYRLMQNATWSDLDQQLAVRIVGSVGRVTRLYQVVSEEPDLPFRVRSYSTRRGGGKLTLQHSPVRAVPRLNELWLSSQSALANVDDDSASAEVEDYEALLLLDDADSGLVTADDRWELGDDHWSAATVKQGAQALPELPQREQWLLREWVLLLDSMNGKNIRLYEEQRLHYRLYEVWADLPAVSLESWHWFGQLLKGRDVLLRYVDMAFDPNDPQRMQAQVHLGITLPLRSGEVLQQVDPRIPIAPLPKQELADWDRNVDDADQRTRGRRRTLR